MPATLHGLLLARLDRLDVAERRVIQEAAVIGPRFELPLLKAVSAEPGAVDAALDALAGADLVTPGPDHRFRHGLLQEIVYQNILVARRTELHTRVGTALEAEGAGGPESLERLEALGHHWALGADKARGARYLMAAGDWARGMYANADAIQHYQRALDALEHCDAPAAATRSRRSGSWPGSGWPTCSARPDDERPPSASTRSSRPGTARRGTRRRRHASFARWGVSTGTPARGHGRSSASRRDSPCSATIESTSSRRTSTRRWAGWPSAAATASGPSSGRSRRGSTPSGSPPIPSLDADGRGEAATAAAQSHNTLGVAWARLGRLEEAVAHIERSVALARENGLLQAACRGLANLSVLYSTLDPGRAIETCAAGLETAKKIGDLGFQSRLYANLAVAYCALTNRCDEQGVGAAHAAIDLDRRLGQLDHLAVPLIVLGQIYQCHGDPTRAIAHYQEALALAEEVGEPQLLFPCYDGLATVHLDLGDEGLAEEFMQKAQAVCERAGLEPDALVVLPFLD